MELRLHIIGSKLEIRELYTGKTVEQDRLLAACTSMEALHAAARLLSDFKYPNLNPWKPS